MFAKFHSHLRGGTQTTRVLGIPGGYPGIPKTRQPYLEGIPISLGIWVWGYPKHGDTQITVTSAFDRRPLRTKICKQGGAGSEVWNRVYMIAPVKKFGRVGLCTNFIPNKHGGGEEGELAELAVIWCTRVCVGSALFPLFQV